MSAPPASPGAREPPRSAAWPCAPAWATDFEKRGSRRLPLPSGPYSGAFFIRAPRCSTLLTRDLISKFCGGLPSLILLLACAPTSGEKPVRASSFGSVCLQYPIFDLDREI